MGVRNCFPPCLCLTGRTAHEIEQEKLLHRITADPNVLVGKPTIHGLRISVEQILNALAGGVSAKDLLQDNGCYVRDGLFCNAGNGLPATTDMGNLFRCDPPELLQFISMGNGPLGGFGVVLKGIGERINSLVFPPSRNTSPASGRLFTSV